MQAAVALDTPDDPKRLSKPELVTSVPAAHTKGPEQLPLIRMLEVVRDRVESIHAGQRNLSAELKDIKANLPVQRKPLSRRTQEIHILAIGSRRNGLCPCCQVEPVCSGTERLASAEFDHWYSRNQNPVTQTWLVCQECNSQSQKSLRTISLPAVAVSALWAHQSKQQQEREWSGADWQDTGYVFTTSRGTPMDPRNIIRLRS